VVGLGYVGLPTAIGLSRAGYEVTGLDISERRLAEIRPGMPGLLPADQPRLRASLEDPTFALTCDPACLAAADAVIVCVPTPIDDNRLPICARCGRRARRWWRMPGPGRR
jgi:UDP-N-acetyl-D-glucosamine dehydrogenase